MSASRRQPVNRNQLGELPGLTGRGPWRTDRPLGAHVRRKGLPARARIRPNDFRIGGNHLAVVNHDRDRDLLFRLRQRLDRIRVERKLFTKKRVGVHPLAFDRDYLMATRDVFVAGAVPYGEMNGGPAFRALLV